MGMVNISVETREQAEVRLRSVMRAVRVDFYANPYCFQELADADIPVSMRRDALALVRDGDRWSQLIPFEDGDEESFGLFSFHFPPGLDNSGFVGWLASHLKDTLGTGVVVVCGMNRDDGGVFDYWGCPARIRDEAFREVKALTCGREDGCSRLIRPEDFPDPAAPV